MNEDRIKCPVCGYMMRILEENEKGFLCYCASCKRDIMVSGDYDD